MAHSIMQDRSLKLPTLFLSFLLAACGDSPQRAIKQVQSAVEKRDILAFEEVVDLERFATKTVSDYLDALLAAQNAPLLAPFVQALKPAASARLTEAIKEGVKNGSMQQWLNAHGQDTAAATVVIQRLGVPWSGVVDVKVAQERGRVALLALTLRNVELDTTFVVDVRMEKGERWRIVAPENVLHYAEQLAAVEELRLTATNDSVLRRFAQHIRTGELRRTVEEYDNDWLSLSMPVENIGPKPIEAAVFRVYSPAGALLSDDQYMIVRELAPGATGLAKLLIDYNRYVDSHASLRFTDGIIARPWYILFGPGDMLATRDKPW